ncbi:collagen alpha-6(VI) chain-like [Tubulanus polymorphus]|uniref:collagen alpha-6(VI) chain-like n=1 Tax=Tubulanus polymorphus TaxID=672921 RepID=UPI003DA5E686
MERPPVPFQDKQLAQAAGIKTVTAGVGSDSVTGSFAAFINPPDKLAALVPKMKTLTRGQLCVALPTTGQPGPVGPPPKCSKIDVLIGCDASGSISASDWSVMMKMVTETVKLLFGAKKNIRVGFYAFAVKPSLLVPLSKGLNAADVEKVISADKPRRLGYGTATSRMLRDASINGFNTDNGARNDSSKVMIVVYDGVSRSANWVKAAADELAAKGVMNIAVATPGVGNAKEFDYIAGKTGDKFVNSTAGKNKWDGYPAKIVELVDKVCFEISEKSLSDLLSHCNICKLFEY